MNEMNKKEFLCKAETLKHKLGVWQLETEQEDFSDFVRGCFYDEEEGKWKVYDNGERGMRIIWLETESEEEAFDELLELINYNCGFNRNHKL